MDKLTIRIVSGAGGKNPLEVPAASPTHFYTSGKILSFNEPNDNGYIFEKDKVPDEMVASLVASTTDLQHVKKGYGFTDSLFPGESNTTVGAILAAQKADDGIYIVNKIERAVAKAFGYTPEDFGPGMIFGKLSQECDFNIAASEWVSLDKTGKIVSRLSYADGIAAGYPMAPNKQWAGSHIENGQWKYHYDKDGNPVYMSVQLLSFAGVGHVVNPADPTATITRIAAAAAQMNSFVPGMDDGPLAAPSAMTFAEDSKTSDGNYFMSDFYTHPDLLNAEVDKFADEDDDGKSPDDHFAASFIKSDYDNVTDGKPAQTKVRAFKIKNDKGEFDRKRLIAAYRAIHGLRGNIEQADRLPFHVRASALALVRHGLKETNKNLQGVTKKVSTLVSGVVLTDAQEAEAVANIEKQLRDAQKIVSKGDYDAKVAEVADLQSQITTLKASLAEAQTAITTLQGEKETLTAKIAEGEAEKLSASRYATLNEILPFSEDEKKAETHVEYVKNLAKLSEEGFENAKLTRTVSKLAAQVNSGATGHAVAAAAGSGAPAVNPVPVLNMNGQTGDNATGVPVLY